MIGSGSLAAAYMRSGKQVGLSLPCGQFKAYDRPQSNSIKPQIGFIPLDTDSGTKTPQNASKACRWLFGHQPILNA